MSGILSKPNDSHKYLRKDKGQIMYIRFVVSAKDEDSHKRMGIFQAAWELRDAGELYDYEEEHFQELRQWFNRYLQEPSSFSRSSKPHARHKGLSWYKDTATIHISKMYEMVAILENHGIHVEVIKSNRLGYLLYEDDYQVAAEAFNDSGA